MYNIHTLNKISKAGLKHFDAAKYNCGEEVQNPDAIMVRSAAMHDMEFGKELLAIARAGAGVNNIPVDRCAKEGIVVFNTPGANANAVKELVILGLLMSSRNVPDALAFAKSLDGEGEAIPKLVEKGKGQFVGPEIKGKTLGVIGLGAIGVMVCNAAKSLGMTVLGYDPYLSVDAAWALSRGIVHAKSVEDIYKNSDYITIHVPYNSETKHMINAEVIDMMKPGVRVLNFARGELVDDDAMLAALEAGKVARYVTDFPNEKTVNTKGVVAVPHLGASTPESEDNCASMAAVELIDYLENGNVVHSVNMPSVSAPRNGGARICIIHQNIPKMLQGISGSFGEIGINIQNMTNRSRGDYAYTIIDLEEKEVPGSLLEQLERVEGIIRARVIPA
ncbi:MAG: 3-phosphoglycerate dehydrogenase [Clostridiales bacterium]|nr:MAG: 3-phosphoglycerate dehydrogenase [Clostridiales bacterium]